jgi:N-acetylglucosamine-6-phosphate deacetylase
MATALVDARILRDDAFVTGHAVLIEHGRIEAVVRDTDPRVAAASSRRSLGGALLMPGFVDVQVNGGGGVLFNATPTVDGIRAIGAAHRRFGTTSFLPTLISDDLSVVAEAIAATRAALHAQVPGVIGVHLEGPFLASARKGTHDAAKFRTLDADAIELLASLATGRTLVTLAPETTTPTHIAQLAAKGVVIAAGHTDATYAVMAEALAHGVTGFTHLFNAMSPFTSRQPGVVGAALYHQTSWCGIIVDGRHVDPVTLKIALNAKRHDRFMLVTDAMPNVGSDRADFQLQGRRIVVKDGVCVDENGVLSGSALDMATAVRNAVKWLGLSLPEAVRMASLHPAAFMGLDHEIGRIAPGYRANLVLTDDELGVIDTWIDGISLQDAHTSSATFASAAP